MQTQQSPDNFIISYDHEAIQDQVQQRNGSKNRPE